MLDGRSQGTFTGRIVVRPAAQKTSAEQTNNNLILSRDALAKSTPQLEILNLGNASTVVRNTPSVGTAYLAPAEILAPRVVKVGFSLSF